MFKITQRKEKVKKRRRKRKEKLNLPYNKTKYLEYIYYTVCDVMNIFLYIFVIIVTNYKKNKNVSEVNTGR